MRILAISGSLRASSSNTTLLRAAADLAPEGVTVPLYAGIGDLPHFNPDLDAEDDAPLPAVADWRAQLQAADAVLICSPEYAHGVPGSLKNALDWVVGSGEFDGKPVALVNASPYSTHATASLAETLRTMNANVVPEASITVPLKGKALDAAGIARTPEIAVPVRASLAALLRAAAR